MSEAKFIEDNWTLRGHEIGIVDTSDTQSNGMMLTICRLDQFDFCDNWRANAYLIACAPEMYAMLKSVSRVQKENYGDAMGLHIAMIYVAKEIEALLAKARGEK